MPRPSRPCRSDPAGRPRVNAPETGDVVCVDLDGTLIAADLLWEAFVRLCTRHPLMAIKALFSLRKGRAAFKQRVAAAVPLAPETLPYRQELLDELAALRQQGAYLVLATATDERYAHAVAGHLGFFADVVASDGRTNMSGRSESGRARRALRGPRISLSGERLVRRAGLERGADGDSPSRHRRA